MNQTPTKPKVILVSASVGAGHNQAAEAILTRLRQLDGSTGARRVDCLAYARWWFRLYYAKGYEFIFTKLPWLYGFGYRLFDKPAGAGRTVSELGRMLLERLGMGRLIRFLLSERPVLVVATHYVFIPMIGRAITRGQKGIRQVVVVTDNDAHRWWYAENVEHYFVPNDEVARQVAAWGVSPERITVSGIPVHPKWTAPLDRAEIYKRWKLPADMPLVILSGGTFFTQSPVPRIARQILDRTAAGVIVLAGNNKSLLNELSQFPEVGKRLWPVPFTDKVQELAEVASLMVTKPGGMITSECIAKGVAMVLTKPVPGQEEANAQMLCREGAAVLAGDTPQIIAAVTDLLANPQRLQQMRDSARRLFRPGADIVAQYVLQALQ
jgi:processive 1,2-diacylglycerol beta-glucosyltransferase